MQIEDEQIQLRKVIPISGNWREDFDRSIQPLLDFTNASYILYRLDSKNNLGYEWLLLTWIPNEAHVKQKTLYASTRNAFRRQFGEGYLADDILCHDKVNRFLFVLYFPTLFLAQLAFFFSSTISP